MNALLSIDWLSAGFGLLLLVGALAIFAQAWKRLRLARARPPDRVAAGATVIVSGRLYRLATNAAPLRSPLSATPCLAYCLEVYESRSSHPAHARVLKHIKKCGLDQLGLEDHLGQCYSVDIVEFDRKQAEFEDAQNGLSRCLHPTSEALIAELGLAKNVVGLRRAIDLREHILCEGAPVKVIARWQRDGDLPRLTQAILTDKPRSRYALEMLPILFGGLLFLLIAIALLGHALRGV